MHEYKWWKHGTIYQIWPASYKDSNGDGVGDIPGILSKLDYVKSLGVDIIWLSPMYDSPQDDMGYDISDYNKVYPKYGTVEDVEKLINGAHERGMKLLLDLVVNHTSSEHAWFKESRSSKTNPKRDWYIWKPARYDEEGKRHPPNNWQSFFSESAWEYDETTDEYYLRLFARTQPDLNWENEECRQAIYESALSFWFKKGIDGFRVDTAGLYSKVQTFEDAPIIFPNNEYHFPGSLVNNGPRIHEFHKEMFASVTSKYDAMTVGEVGGCSKEDALKYVSAKEKELSMLFLFDLVSLGTTPGHKYKYKGFNFQEFKQSIQTQCDFVKGTDAWSTVFIENHDQPRCVTRFGSTSTLENTFKSAKLIALFQSTLTGTMYIYQGQEIGMTNLPRSWDIKEYLDIESTNAYAELFKEYPDITDPATDVRVQKFLDAAALVARDHSRSPVQWDSSAYGGFSTAKPWMRVNDNYKEINVAGQLDDPKSVLNFYRQCLKVRGEFKDLLVYGDFEILDFDNNKVFTYVKSNPDVTQAKAYVALNFSDDAVSFEKLIEGDYKLVNTNVESVKETILSPWEGRLYLVQ